MYKIIHIYKFKIFISKNKKILFKFYQRILQNFPLILKMFSSTLCAKGHLLLLYYTQPVSELMKISEALSHLPGLDSKDIYRIVFVN